MIELPEDRLICRICLITLILCRINRQILNTGTACFFPFAALAVSSFFFSIIIEKLWQIIRKELKFIHKKLPFYYILFYFFLCVKLLLSYTPYTSRTFYDSYYELQYSHINKQMFILHFINQLIIATVEEILLRRYFYHLAKSNLNFFLSIKNRKFKISIAILLLALSNVLLSGIYRILFDPYTLFPNNFKIFVMLELFLIISSEITLFITLPIVLRLFEGFFIQSGAKICEKLCGNNWTGLISKP